MPITRSRANKDDIFEPRPPHILEKKKNPIFQETVVDNAITTGSRTHLFPFQLLDYIPIPNADTFDKMCQLVENILLCIILLVSVFLVYIVGFYALMDIYLPYPHYLCGIGFIYSILWAFVVNGMVNYL
jgi:hypothetical protein